MVRRLIILLLTALAIPAGAAAADYPPSTLARAVAIADAQWPASPCHGHLHPTVAVLPADVQALAYLDGSCRIDVTAGLDPVRLCQVMAHEAGHENRQDDWHSPDPHNIMAPDGGDLFQPCLAMDAQPPVTPRELAAKVTDARPAACRLVAVSHRRRTRTYRCGRHSRALVFLAADGTADGADAL